MQVVSTLLVIHVVSTLTLIQIFTAKAVFRIVLICGHAYEFQ